MAIAVTKMVLNHHGCCRYKDGSLTVHGCNTCKDIS